MTRWRRRLEDLRTRSLQRLGLALPADAPLLVDELARLFLDELIQGRVAYLDQRDGGGGRSVAAIRDEITARCIDALALAIAAQCKPALAQAPAHEHAAWRALATPRGLALPAPLVATDFVSRAAFEHQVLRRIRFARGSGPALTRPLRALAPAQLAQVCLAALQQVGVAQLLRDYQLSTVPGAAQQALAEVLQRLDAVARRVRPEPPLASAAEVDIGFQVALARHEQRVYLPLRPIATAPLQFGPQSRHYGSRLDDEARRLARQLRHADGVILVSGYRGVGKSSFVNRALHHVRLAQAEAPADGWIVVPVALSLAKAAGVAGALRLTLRAVRAALLDPDSGRPRPVPGLRDGSALPLLPDELEALAFAYLRATRKVVLNRLSVDERNWEAGARLELDPGAPFGHSVGKWFSLGGKRARQQKVSRELGLLDYDEDAAEADISNLIDRLARPRPLGPGGPAVRLKLALVFDELDKMDTETGLKPMLEALKNLFLREHAVFVMVTSKQLYYELLSQRAVEDARLSSYFSGVLHVPLMNHAQVLEMLRDWVDAPAVATASAAAPSEAEARVLDRLARYLCYRSLGNPRDLIRELRQMQLWSEAGDRPYLTERITRVPEVAVFAAIQEAIERVAEPSLALPAEGAGEGVTLASERVSADEARLEQIRRGLYILVEALIDRQALALDSEEFDRIRRDNFSLLSAADVLQYARQLGHKLSTLTMAVADEAEAAPAATGGRAALFSVETGPDSTVLRVSREFYALTGRRAAQAETPGSAPQSPTELAAEARSLLGHGGRTERRSAIGLIGRLDPGTLAADLQAFLLEVFDSDPDPDYRLAAIERLPAAALFAPGFELGPSLARQTDGRVIGASLRKLGEGAVNTETRAAATEALLRLLGHAPGETTVGITRRIGFGMKTLIGDANAIEAFRLLETVAEADITDALVALLAASTFAPAPLLERGLDTLVANASRHGWVDAIEPLLGSESLLRAQTLHPQLAQRLPALVQPHFAAAARRLMDAPSGTEPLALLRVVLTAGAGANDEPLAALLLDDLAAGPVGPDPPSPAQTRLRRALAAAESDSKLVRTFVEAAAARALQAGRIDGVAAARVHATLQALPKVEAVSVPAWPGLFGAPAPPLGLPTWLGGNLSDGTDAYLRGVNRSQWDALLQQQPSPRPMRLRKADPLGIALLLAAPIPFIATLFIPGDVPADASLWTLLLARTLSLAMPLSLALAFEVISAQTGEMIRRSRYQDATLSAGSGGGVNWVEQFVWLIPVIGWLGASELHKAWVGPMSFGPQAIFFALNLLAVVLAWVGLHRMSDD